MWNVMGHTFTILYGLKKKKKYPWLVGDAGDWTRDLTHAKRALYHWATSPSRESPFCYRYSFRLALDLRLWLKFQDFILVRASAVSSFLLLPLPLETVSGMYQNSMQPALCDANLTGSRALLPGAWSPNWHPAPCRAARRDVPAQSASPSPTPPSAYCAGAAERGGGGASGALLRRRAPSTGYEGAGGNRRERCPSAKGDLLLKQSGGDLLCTAENLSDLPVQPPLPHQNKPTSQENMFTPNPHKLAFVGVTANS